jgi:uncharacterized surface anchored protein
MKWTVDVHVPDGAVVTGASITDTLSEGHQLICSAGYPASFSEGGGEARLFTEGTGAGQYTRSDRQITFTLGDLELPARIVYYTQVTDPEVSFNTNGAVSFRNDAAFDWDRRPEGDDGKPADRTKVNVIGAGGLLSKGAGSAVSYDTGRDVIRWSVRVNRNQITIHDPKIIDSVPSGQALLIDGEHPFVVQKDGSDHFRTASPAVAGGLHSDDGFIRSFSYTFADEDESTAEVTISSTYVVTYYTRITDGDEGLSRLYYNGKVDFGNSVVLTRSSEGGTVSDSGSQRYYSQMIAKSVASCYDYSDRSVQWKLVVNRNRLPLTNAVVTDALPQGMELLLRPDYPFEVVENGETPEVVAVSPTSGKNGDTAFSVELPAHTSRQYTITFYTKLTDAALLAQGQGSQTYQNNAELHAAEVERLTASADVSVNNPVVVKSHCYEPGTDVIDWSVAINAGQVDLYDAVVKDDLHDMLELVPGSLKLYAVSVFADGSLGAASEATLVDGAAYRTTLPAADNGNLLTVELPNGAQAYRLEFSTYILADNADIVNQVSLDGTSGSPSGTDDAARITINDLWSGGGSGSGMLTIHKENGAGTPLAGATFRLLNIDREPIMRGESYVEAVTDDNGDAVFANLPAWVFYAVEVDPPAGYLVNPDFLGGERLNSDLQYNTTDAPARGTLQFTKESVNGTPLNGGMFVLTGTDYNGSAISASAAAVNGTVTFYDLPLGDYSVTETASPEGYLLTSEPLTAVVDYNGDKTKTEVVITSPAGKMINEPLPYATVQLQKTDGLAPLEGAGFALYDSAGGFVANAMSDSAGIVRFPQVAEGAYTIREIAVPSGYAASEEVIRVSVTADDFATVVKTEPYTVVNEPVGAVIKVKKTDGISGRLLAGAVFSLTDADNAVVMFAETGADGVATFTDIMPGAYTVSETKAPDGYRLSGAPLVVFAELGKQYSLSVQNSPSGYLPQSGTLLDGYVTVIIGGVCLAAGAAVLLVRRSGRRGNKRR